jgi:hypothetical protein
VLFGEIRPSIQRKRRRLTKQEARQQAAARRRTPPRIIRADFDTQNAHGRARAALPT